MDWVPARAARWRRRAWRRRRSRRPSPPEAWGPGAPCSSGTSRTPSTLGALEAPADVHCFQFNKATAAGRRRPADGRACFWDLSETTRARQASHHDTFFPKFVSEAPDSHVRGDGRALARRGRRRHQAARQLARPNPPSGACAFFTAAADGKVLFWDVDVKKDAKRREFVFAPAYRIALGRGEQSALQA